MTIDANDLEKMATKLDTDQIQANIRAFEKAVADFVGGYEIDTGEGIYHPTAHERFLIDMALRDALHDDDFAPTFAALVKNAAPVAAQPQDEPTCDKCDLEDGCICRRESGCASESCKYYKAQPVQDKPQEAGQARELPPLPEPWITNLSTKDPAARHHYAEDQMLDYARAAIAQAAAAVPEILFDGYAVLQALDGKAKTRTRPENVSDVLDAAVKLIRASAPSTPSIPAEQLAMALCLLGAVETVCMQSGTDVAEMVEWLDSDGGLVKLILAAPRGLLLCKDDAAIAAQSQAIGAGGQG